MNCSDVIFGNMFNFLFLFFIVDRGLVMTVAPCNHPTVMKDMCADCGADLRV